MARPIHVLASSLLLCLAVVALPAPALAQATELFFSEYVEGSSNNKALEIYNGTGSPVNLAASGYNVQMHFNGNPVATLTINLTGTVAAGDVYVLAQASASATILAQADQTNASGWFNGDDAVVLRKGTTPVDVIGQIGFDPGSEWGSGLTSTADNTLRRKLSIVAGDANGANAFDPSLEWEGFATDTFGGLGAHAVEPPPPAATFAEIWEIQGAGLASPLAGQARYTRGIVTAVFSDGFFIQAPAPGDSNPATSDGLWVYTGSQPTVAAGDVVAATGTVTEYFNMTELNLTEPPVTLSVEALPEAVLFDATRPSPLPQLAPELERYEGMLVRVDHGIVSSPTNEYNEASVVAGSRRAFREGGILFPGLPGLPVWDGNPEIFEIDTDRYAADPGAQLLGGAVVSAQGPLAFSFGDYQIWPTLLEATSREFGAVRARGTGEFTVASQNVLRLFDALDDPAVADELPSAAAYAQRLAKLSLHVRVVLDAPDVLALQEVENLATLQDLADRIAADDPSIGYTAYLLEGNDVGGIDVGFLVRDSVRVDSVVQFGKDDTFEFNGQAALLNDRPPLVLRGAYVRGGASFPITVVNVHQRSLSGIDGNDGPRVRAKRHEQALRLSQYLQGLQAADPGVKLIVLGDFNAFEFSDGYVDVMGQVTGAPDPAGALLPASDEITPDLSNQTLLLPADERYSFVFDGTAQSLDHALTSQPLAPFLRGAVHSRGNADAPYAYAALADTPLRVSDHDATVVYLTSDTDADGVPENLDRCPATRMPEGEKLQLQPNHYALADGDRVFDTPPSESPSAVFTLDDTAGCSCEQILDAGPGLALGQRKFGCPAGTVTSWIEALRR